MKLSKFIFIILILLSSFGCKKKEVSESDFEKDVLNSVFLEIVDSIYMDRRTLLPPPPPKFNFKTNKADTTGHSAELKKYWREQDSIKNDKHRILIGVYELVKNRREFKTKKNQNPLIDLKLVQNDSIGSFKFDLTPFKNNKKFDFQYASKFPPEHLWDLNDKKSLMPVGTITVYKIHFNKSKTSGTLDASASCGGGKCGRGFEITIENKSGKWHITKIVQTWVS